MKEESTFNIPVNDTVTEIIPGMREQGKGIKKIAHELGIGVSTVQRVVNESRP